MPGLPNPAFRVRHSSHLPEPNLLHCPEFVGDGFVRVTDLPPQLESFTAKDRRTFTKPSRGANYGRHYATVSTKSRLADGSDRLGHHECIRIPDTNVAKQARINFDLAGQRDRELVDQNFDAATP
jgi:hypothetical protein